LEELALLSVVMLLMETKERGQWAGCHPARGLKMAV
jgi:hypothetical protein